MSSQGFACYGSKHGGEGNAQWSSTSIKGSRGAFSHDHELPLGDLVVTLRAVDVLPSGGHIKQSNFQCIASYNWLDSSEPVILVPGAPAIWSPPAHRRKLQPDRGEVFIDQNTARYPKFPLEPMLRASYEVHPELDLEDIDVIICRNSMVKLLDFVTANPRNFEMDVEVVGDKALFIRKEKQTTEFISEFRGFGRTLPEEYTRWDSTVKGSSSHHRIARYGFAGLNYLLRFESDGYLAEKGEVVKMASPRPGEVSADPADVANLLGSKDAFTIAEHRPILGSSLVVRNEGTRIDQRAMIEIKTRAAHKGLDTESVLPRLWLSQTPYLVAAYHKGGRFDDVQILDVRKDLEQWEKRNSENLQKLDAIIRRVLDTVRNTISMKCRLRRTTSGELEIRELDVSHPNALPDDLREKLSE